jgi:molybdopterin molybdotransferase
VRRERVRTENALGRVLAAPIVSGQDLPDFTRSTVDGFAVAAADTWGASPGLPALLTIVGEVAMGAAAELQLGMGEAALVHTGGMLPAGADAVVMVEQTQRVDAASVEVMQPVAEGQNVVQIGEDVTQGSQVLAAGHRLRPQDIGGLMALGLVEIEVARPPRVGILSTGDEVIPPDQPVRPGQVRDINSYALAALAQQVGAEPVRYGIIPDQRAALEAAAQRAFAECDVVILSAGSSVSYRDMSAQVIAGLGKPGILTHGVSVKPGKPTILALCDGKPVFGLPGNPVSALVIFDLFITPALRLLLGETPPRPVTVSARLARNLSSDTGREDYVQVLLEERAGELWAVPVLGKSNLIYTLVHADGSVQVPLDSNGIRAGEKVVVRIGGGGEGVRGGKLGIVNCEL